MSVTGIALVLFLTFHMAMNLVALVSTHPSEDVDVVPCFFVVFAGRIVVDTYFMINISVEIRIFFRFEDSVDYRQLADFFCLEVVRIIKHFTVAVTEDIGREPTVH